MTSKSLVDAANAALSAMNRMIASGEWYTPEQIASDLHDAIARQSSTSSDVHSIKSALADLTYRLEKHLAFEDTEIREKLASITNSVNQLALSETASKVKPVPAMYQVRTLYPGGRRGEWREVRPDGGASMVDWINELKQLKSLDGTPHCEVRELYDVQHPSTAISLTKRIFTQVEKGEAGYKLVVGFMTLQDAQAAYDFVTQTGAPTIPEPINPQPVTPKTLVPAGWSVEQVNSRSVRVTNPIGDSTIVSCTPSEARWVHEYMLWELALALTRNSP